MEIKQLPFDFNLHWQPSKKTLRRDLFILEEQGNHSKMFGLDVKYGFDICLLRISLVLLCHRTKLVDKRGICSMIC